MSKKLKQIVESLATGNNRFAKDDLHRVLERKDTGEQKFTGYYADDDNNVYTSKAWSKKLIIKKKEAQKEQLDIFEQEQEEALRERKKRILIFLMGFVVVFVAAVIVFFANWNTQESLPQEQTTVNKVKSTPLSEFTSIKIDSSFGDARITGSDVNMRDKPNLNAAIIDFFAKEGERVTMIQRATDTLSWCKVARKDGTTGWVFSEYVEEIKSSKD